MLTRMPIHVPTFSIRVTAILLCVLPLAAQVPNTLLRAIPAPLGSQIGGEFGTCVATDENYIAIGVPLDDTGASNSGVVKVFNSTTSELLHVLVNPTPASGDQFGTSVAVSGSFVAVGTWADDTGGTNAGSVYIYNLSGANPTVPSLTINNPEAPVADDWFGYSVALSGSRLTVGAIRNTVAGLAAGSVYVFDLTSVSPTVPIFTLNNPDPAIDDWFGFSVSISGTRVIVGAPNDDTGSSDTGSAYVYDLAGPAPTVPATTLRNPTPAAGDLFGYSVGISNPRVIVGAYGDNTGATDAGSAYIYDLAGATPSFPVGTLNNPSPGSGDSFGRAVSISGAHTVVGAYFDKVGTVFAGRAFVFDLDGISPNIPIATLDNPNPAANDYFGWAVAITGSRAVVTARLDDTGASEAGSAYVYDTSGPAPATPVRTLVSPGPAVNDQFGYSVAVSGTRIVVGVPFDDSGSANGSSNTGRVYVYDLSSVTPTVPVLTLSNPPPSPNSSDNFGSAVAMSGTTLVVGAQLDSLKASDAGNAYVYNLAGPNPTTPVFTLNKPGALAGDRFGNAVAISGNKVVVGAYVDGTGGVAAGSAYVFDLEGVTPTVPIAVLNNPTPASSDYFGWAVAIAGAKVAVGAWQDDTVAANAGSVYLFDLDSATPTVPVATLNKPGAATVIDNFGRSVAMSGTRLVVGAHGDDTGATNAGSAYVFDISDASAPQLTTTLRAPSPTSLDAFGWSVAIAGTHVVVGANLANAPAADAGIAYVYDLGSGTPTLPAATLNNPTPSTNDQFGYSLATDGAIAVVATPFDDSTAQDEGAIYIFGPVDADNDGLLDSWELAYWPDTTSHNPLDDSDHDGICELLELAFGLNPTQPSSSALPAAIDEGGYLTMTLTKQSGVLYEIQSAGTLLPGQPDSFSAASTTVITNNATTLKVRDNFLLSTTPNRFMRVKVTAAP